MYVNEMREDGVGANRTDKHRYTSNLNINRHDGLHLSNDRYKYLIFEDQRPKPINNVGSSHNDASHDQ